MCDNRKWTGPTPDSFSNKTGYNERSLKVMGVKNEIRATSVVANEVAKMGRKEVREYSLKRSEKLKLYQRKHHLNLALKVKLLLFMACYFKG